MLLIKTVYDTISLFRYNVALYDRDPIKLSHISNASSDRVFQWSYACLQIVAMACVVLASKIEEAPRRVRDVLNAFHHLEQLRRKQNPEPLLLDHSYMALKNQVIKAERRVLKELGFCVHVKHPHKVSIAFNSNASDNFRNFMLFKLYSTVGWNLNNIYSKSKKLRTGLFIYSNI